MKIGSVMDEMLLLFVVDVHVIVVIVVVDPANLRLKFG